MPFIQEIFGPAANVFENRNASVARLRPYMMRQNHAADGSKIEKEKSSYFSSIPKFLFFFFIPQVAFADPPTFSREQCRQLITNHKPQPDVAYQPDVDASGSPVVPADLTPPKTYGLGDNSQIYIGKRFKGSKGHYADANIGTITVTKEGKVLINDELVGDEQREEIENFCRDQHPDLN